MVKYLDLRSAQVTQVQQASESLQWSHIQRSSASLDRRVANEDISEYVTDYTDSWSNDGNRVWLFPNAYDVFTRRGFLGTSSC